jgi:uncharacterized membrane protein YeiH
MNALSLMAAPTFAVMALVTAIGGGPIDGFCGTSPLGGMAPMYLLMSVFHAAPWLKYFLPSFAGEVSAKRTEGA